MEGALGTRSRPVALLPAMVVLACGSVAAQTAGEYQTSVRVDDSLTTDPRLKSGDCAALVANAGENALEVMVQMARPFAEGMYTRVVLWIDCDDNEKTGLENGNELVVRAAIGTRFGPNTPRAGSPEGRSPLSIRRCSYSDIDQEDTASTGRSRRTWMHRDSLEEPTVDSDQLRFRVPKDLIRRSGDRYHARFTAVVRVDTVCSEQPVLLEHVCADEGVPFKVDGSDEEWAGGTSATDLPDELHSAGSTVDLTGVTVDHSSKRLLALLRFQEPGFAHGFGLEGPDVFRRDRAVVRIEPFLPSYSKPRTCEIPAGVAEGEDDGVRWAAKDGRLEVGIPRASGEGRYRATVWTDAMRHDRVPDAGRMKLVFPP